MNKISIIIPIFNEVNSINNLLTYLDDKISKTIDYEFIIVDGGSSDGSQNSIIKNEKTIVLNSAKGRSKQMNFGAKNASGDIFYFLHCDSFPPKHFDVFIVDKIYKGKQAGCFKMKFDYFHPVLWVSQWFTKFNHISCRGGDQSLFVHRDVFNEIGGFNEDYVICEDNEICKKLYAKVGFSVIQKNIITSARRYKENGVWRLQYHFLMIHLRNRIGYSPESLLNYYTKNVQ